MIRLDHSVIERLNIEVMRGFGVTRRRGTETGGILIGKIDRRTQPVIHIQDYEIVPCEYASGPSYILSANDKQKFKETRSSDGSHRSSGSCMRLAIFEAIRGTVSVWMRETLRCSASTSEIRSMWLY